MDVHTFMAKVRALQKNPTSKKNKFCLGRADKILENRNKCPNLSGYFDSNSLYCFGNPHLSVDAP